MADKISSCVQDSVIKLHKYSLFGYNSTFTWTVVTHDITISHCFNIYYCIFDINSILQGCSSKVLTRHVQSNQCFSHGWRDLSKFGSQLNCKFHLLAWPKMSEHGNVKSLVTRCIQLGYLMKLVQIISLMCLLVLGLRPV